jgi:hypothetical protein
MMEILKTVGAFLVGVFGVFVAFAGIIVLMGVLWAIPTMLLWDWLMPELFGLSTITIWQALGLNILSGILFKSKTNTTKNEVKERPKNKSIILG